MPSTLSLRWLAGVTVALATAGGCYAPSDLASTDGGPADVDATPGPTVDAGPVTSAELPCAAADALATCLACHGTPLRGGATLALDTLAALRAPSPSFPGTTVAARSLVRMRAVTAPMPPTGYPGPSAAQIAAFSTWVSASTPAGTCNTVPDPTVPAPTVCTSGRKWTGGNSENPDMNPGLACRACHLSHAADKAYFFMGTVYPTLHEQDTCNSTAPVGTKVQILDAHGVVAVTMTVRTSGNFYSRATTAGITLPYTARVVSPSGSVISMTTPQTNGDCNSCHTEQGTMSALGRVLMPTP